MPDRTPNRREGGAIMSPQTQIPQFFEDNVRTAHAETEKSKSKHPQIIEAVIQARDLAQTLKGMQASLQSIAWIIGKAFVTELGPPSTNGKRDGSRAKIQEIYDEIVETLGACDYDVTTLVKMWHVAYRFSDNRRRHGLSWSVHEAAGSPEVLEEISAAHPGVELTRKIVRAYRATQDQAARQARAAAENAARQDRAAAKAAEQEALATLRTAETEEAREAALRQRVAAQAQNRAAFQILCHLPAAPAERAKPKTTLKMALAACQAVEKAAARLAMIQKLKPEEQATLSAKIAEVTTAWQQAVLVSL
jgi:hypothetical protein